MGESSGCWQLALRRSVRGSEGEEEDEEEEDEEVTCALIVVGGRIITLPLALFQWPSVWMSGSGARARACHCKTFAARVFYVYS